MTLRPIDGTAFRGRGNAAKPAAPVKNFRRLFNIEKVTFGAYVFT
jgi:hypothetical protein